MTANDVNHLLTRTHRLVFLTDLAGAMLRGAVWVIGAVVGLVLVDAALGLPATGLVVLDALLLAVVLVVAGKLLWIAWCGRFRGARVARLIEQRVGVDGSRLINALEFGGAVPASASAALSDWAVRDGNDTARRVEPGRVVAWDRLRHAGIVFGVALLLVGAFYLSAPNVVGAVVPRLADPFGNHPPYTALRFDVSVEPEPLYAGRPAEVHAVLRGPVAVDRAAVVFLDGPDDPTARAPMLPRAQDLAAAGSAASDNSRTFVLRIDRAERSRSFYIDTPQGRSPTYELHVVPVPQFDAVRVTYDFPAYTAWDDTVQPVDADGLRALAGTAARLRVQSNVPLKSGVIDFQPADPAAPPQRIALRPDPDDPTAVVGVLPITTDGHAALSLTGRDGTPSDEALTLPVAVVPDAAPRIAISAPEPRLVVPVGWAVDVRLDTADDIGVDRLTLQRSVNQWGASRIELDPVHDGPDRTRASSTYRFDLAELGARAGDVIHYHATVYDNHPGTANAADSDIHVIQVISEEEYLEFARTRYRIDQIHDEFNALQDELAALERARQEALEQLEQLENKLAAGQPLTDQEALALRDLEDRLETYRAQADDLATELRERVDQPSLYEFEDAYKEKLAALADQLEQQTRLADALGAATSQLRQDQAAPQRERFARAAEAFRADDAPFDETSAAEQAQTQQDLEALRLAEELQAQGERLRMIIQEQDDLAQRLSAFNHADTLSGADQLRLQRMAQEQSALETELTETTAALRAAADAAQDLLPNMSAGAMSIADRIDSMNIVGDMNQAAARAAAGQHRDAYAPARAAADKLDSLLSDCNSMGQQADSDLDGCFNLPRESISQSLQQMAQARGVPGMGQRGGDGAGFSGSQARMAIRGPAQLGQNGGGADGRLSGAAGEGGGQTDGRVETLEPVETLRPGERTGRGGAGGVLGGVPLPYRGEAEAYFRRLADDAVGD